MTTKIELRSVKQAPKGTLSRLIWVTPLAVAAATLANLGLYAGAGILFPEVTAWSGTGLGQIVGANIVYLLIGAIVFAVIARLSSRPARHYLIVATIGLLLSLGLPISAGFGSSPPAAATVITLSLLHVVSFAISVPLFNRLALD